MPSAHDSAESAEIVNASLVKQWLFWGIVWTMIFPLVGLYVSVKFNYPDYLGGISWLTWGRVRPVHVNGVIFGAFSTTFFGLMYFMVPKLAGVRMVGEKLGYWSLWLWNIGVVGGSIGVLAGYNKGIEVGDYPLIMDVPLELALILMSYSVIATIVRRKEKYLYVSLYYVVSALVWTTINLGLGSFILPYHIAGVNNAALHGLYIHYIIGLWITPAGLALIFFFLPLAAKNPLYSHKLSLIGFWSIAFFYPFVGIHHYLYSPIPNWTQTIAIVTSMMLIVPVWTVTVNFFGTMAGNWRSFQESFVARFCIVGAIYYFLGTFQGSMEALRGVQQVTHFTDFVISHSHLTIFGTFVIWTMAGVYYVWPRVTGNALWSRKLAKWHFWLTIVSFTSMVGVLAVMGLMQGTMWADQVEFVDTVVAMKPYWFVRTITGFGMDVGIFLFMLNMFMTAVKPSPLIELERENDQGFSGAAAD
jgi:cytochrome c oxidase cbb3-type subunit 1